MIKPGTVVRIRGVMGESIYDPENIITGNKRPPYKSYGIVVDSIIPEGWHPRVFLAYVKVPGGKILAITVSEDKREKVLIPVKLGRVELFNLKLELS